MVPENLHFWQVPKWCSCCWCNDHTQTCCLRPGLLQCGPKVGTTWELARKEELQATAQASRNQNLCLVSFSKCGMYAHYSLRGLVSITCFDSFEDFYCQSKINLIWQPYRNSYNIKINSDHKKDQIRLYGWLGTNLSPLTPCGSASRPSNRGRIMCSKWQQCKRLLIHTCSVQPDAWVGVGNELFNSFSISKTMT